MLAQHSEMEDHGIRSHHFTGNRWGNSGNSVRLYFLGLQNHCGQWTGLLLRKRAMTNLDSTLKSKDIILSTRSI